MANLGASAEPSKETGAAGGAGCLVLFGIFYFCGFGGCEGTPAVPVAENTAEERARPDQAAKPVRQLTAEEQEAANVERELRDNDKARAFVEASLSALKAGNPDKARDQIDKAIYETDGYFSEPPAVVIRILKRVTQAQVQACVTDAEVQAKNLQVSGAIAELGAAQSIIDTSNASKFKPRLDTSAFHECAAQTITQAVRKASSLTKAGSLADATTLVTQAEQFREYNEQDFELLQQTIIQASDPVVDRLLDQAQAALDADDPKSAKRLLDEADFPIYHSRTHHLDLMRQEIATKVRNIEADESRKIAATTSWYWRCPNTNTEWRIESSLRQLANGNYQLTERHRGGEGGSDTWTYKKSGEMYRGIPAQTSGEKRLPFKIDKNGDRIVYWNGKPEQIHYRMKEDAEKFKRGQWNLR